MSRLRVDVWSDIACPWCYVGKRRFEAALERFSHRDNVDIVWHAFELDPGAPPERNASVSYTERLARKYGRSTAQAQQMIDRTAESARGDGLDFRFDRIRSGSTFDAHRLVHSPAPGKRRCSSPKPRSRAWCAGPTAAERVLSRYKSSEPPPVRG